MSNFNKVGTFMKTFGTQIQADNGGKSFLATELVKMPLLHRLETLADFRPHRGTRTYEECPCAPRGCRAHPAERSRRLFEETLEPPAALSGS